MNIGIVQMQSVVLHQDENLEHARQFITSLCKKGIEFIVLPEFFSCGYSYGSEMMAAAENRKDGRTVSWLVDQAKEKNVYILTSIYEIENGNYYNTMILAGPNGQIQYYRKRNPFWQEYSLYQRGATPGPGIFDTEIGRIGGVICFDAFAKESYENLKANQVDLIAICACWGSPVTTSGHPELRAARRMLNVLASQATEELTAKYARSLHVPVVHVGQGGVSQSSIPVPRYWPFKSIEQKIESEFWGHSNVKNAAGINITCAKGGESQFIAVASVDVAPNSSRQAIRRMRIKASYLSRKYYYEQPAYGSKILQEWCRRGFKKEYDHRRNELAV